MRLLNEIKGFALWCLVMWRARRWGYIECLKWLNGLGGADYYLMQKWAKWFSVPRDIVVCDDWRDVTLDSSTSMNSNDWRELLGAQGVKIVDGGRIPSTWAFWDNDLDAMYDDL